MASAPVVKVLSVDELVLDAGTQSRVAISEVTIEEYLEVLAAAGARWPFPNLDVFHDGNQYLVAAGFHRTLTARRHGRSSVPCNVHQGTAWDALLFGMRSNQEHGLRPTQADRHHSVELLIDSGKKLTQQQIADMVGVALRTVARIVAERKSENVPLAHSGDDDPFADKDDPFGEGEDGDTDVDGQDAQQEALPPRTPRNGKDEPGGSPKRTPAEEFKIQKSKTVKTAEALMRAFDDLNKLRKSAEHKSAIEGCKALLHKAQNWK